ncbi:MAG TPA: hypothetical protein VLD57_11815 [Blastocatellia bacterium]|nr:hypothetical protein [Blastocatellia bacterium]
MRRTSTTTEVERVIVIRASGPLPAWCEACSGQTTMIKPEHAATLIGATCRRIYQMVEAGLLHFIEPPDGSLLICRNSLPQQ